MSLSLLPAVRTQDLTITDDGHQFFLTLWILASSAPCPHCGQLSSRFHRRDRRRRQKLTRIRTWRAFARRASPLRIRASYRASHWASRR